MSLQSYCTGMNGDSLRQFKGRTKTFTNIVLLADVTAIAVEHGELNQTSYLFLHCTPDMIQKYLCLRYLLYMDTDTSTKPYSDARRMKKSISG